MALDKLVDSTQLDSDLTSVANAIRAKSGGSSQLAFPTGFVSEIGKIPSGGLPSPITQFATGQFTLAADATELQITHNIGEYPSILYIYPDWRLTTYRYYNGGITASYLYNNKNSQAYSLIKYIHATSKNILAQAVQPLAANFKGNTATVNSQSASYPFPTKWHKTDGDEGETIIWRWVAISLDSHY